MRPEANAHDVESNSQPQRDRCLARADGGADGGVRGSERGYVVLGGGDAYIDEGDHEGELSEPKTVRTKLRSVARKEKARNE